MKKWLDNYNDSKVELPEGFVGMGNNIQGKNYSPAWGGQFQDGGDILGKTFLQPNNPKLPVGWNPKEKGYSTEYSTTIGKDGEYYLVPGFKHGKLVSDPEKEFYTTGEMLGGPFKTIQSAEDFANRRHKYVEQGKPLPSPMKTYDYLKFAMGGSVPGAVGFTYARTQDPAPSNGKYAKKTLASAENGKKFSMEDVKKNATSKKYPSAKEMQGFFSKGKQDSNFENVVEIIDPTGISSWDDIADSYRETGISPQTGLEVFGALPMLGKLGKIGKIAETAAKAFAVTGRQKRNAKAVSETLKGIGKYGPSVGRATDAYQAYDQWQNGGEMKYYQEGLDFKPKSISEDGKAMPKAYWKSNEQREEYRNRLREIGKKALQEGSDENFLLETPYHKISEGNNCISGVCGLNRAAGLEYSNPTDVDRYLGNTRFSDAVKAGKEDYYQVSGNFQIGDHIQYLNEKGAPHHSKMIYDITTNDKGDKEYHVIHNSGGESFVENIYSEADMKDMLAGKMPLTALNYSKINIYRPGYTLDKSLIDKEREAKTSPEARAALVKRKELQEWDATHNPGFEYSIRPDSEYYKNQPEGMKKFIDFANDDAKVTELAKKLNVGKDIVHDQLLNTFGELGQENKWADRWFGGTGGIENTIEKLFSPGNMSIGPGQIKFKTLDPELKEKFNIKKAKDLHDIEKVIPLMTAINVRNKQYMERQGENLSTKLVGTPGTSADEIKYGIDRWVPYMYRGTIVDPIASVRKQAEANASEYRMSTKDREKYINKYISENVDPERLKTFDKGSYAERVYDLIDKNLKRTMPAQNYEQYNELMPVTVTSKKKKDGGWLNKYK